MTDLIHSGTVAPYRADTVVDLSLAGRCIPAGLRGQPVAGDFFDIVRLDTSRVLIAVGDVAGHGFGAASRMKQLRASTRAFARDASTPISVLQQLDEVQVAGDTDAIATLWLGIYESATGLLCYSSAGHPPPVLAEIGRSPRLLAEASAPPLGTGVVGEHATTEELQWPVSALLVAYSDGLVERPSCDLEDQLHLLRELVEHAYTPARLNATPRSLAETILNQLVPDPSVAHDDICILVLRREAPGEAGP
jgi:serine phosphatase RsbU (regulator of sigma subunit)